MKTTLEIADGLLERARRHAARTDQTLRAVVEEGLRRVLESSEPPPERWALPDRSVGDPDAPDPLEQLTWQDLRAEIYGGR